MRSLATANGKVAASSRRPSFTASRKPILADRGLRVPVPAVARSLGTEDAPYTPLHMLLSGAVGLGLLAPGASLAVEQMPSLLPQQVAVEMAVVQPAVQQDMQYAPDLVDTPVTDTEVEGDDSRTGGNMFVNGLEWMVEEGLEVTNFKENNFAAVGAPSASMWLSNSPWCLMWDAYCNVLTQRPVATKLATGMVGTFLGDMLAQATQGLMRTSAAAATIRGRSSRANGSSRAAAAAGSSSGQAGGAFDLNLARTARLVAFSALVGTPVAFVWFNLLDQYVMPTDPTNPLAVFSKVALDQVLMAPCMTSMFFASMALLEGSRGSQVADTVKSKLRPTLLANWTVWPIAHVINFALVPPAQRILYINVINIAWTAFMSHMASNSSQDKPAGQPTAAHNSNRSNKQLQQAGRGL